MKKIVLIMMMVASLFASNDMNKKNTVKKVIALGYKAQKRDKYKRLLVWIEVLNFSLVRQGWAVYYPNNQISKERKAYLLKLSRDANVNHRGIYARY